jgi:hypothetical protein
VWQLILAAPLIVIAGFVLLPILILYALTYWVWGLALRARALAAWPKDKVAVFAYARSGTWALYIQETLLPVVCSACIVIDRSQGSGSNAFRLRGK